MSAENTFGQEHSSEGGGIITWIKGTRLAKAIHKLNSGRYEQYVPKRIRDLGESRGIPLPLVYVPSAEGTGRSIAEYERLAGVGKRVVDEYEASHPSEELVD